MGREVRIRTIRAKTKTGSGGRWRHVRWPSSASHDTVLVRLRLRIYRGIPLWLREYFSKIGVVFSFKDVVPVMITFPG